MTLAHRQSAAAEAADAIVQARVFLEAARVTLS